MEATKFMLARILGEIFRIQNSGGGVKPYATVTWAEIYGLMVGIEPVIDKVFDIRPITDQQMSAIVDALKAISADPEGKAFSGYRDFEPVAEKAGVDRIRALRILQYLKMDGQFTRLIKNISTEEVSFGVIKGLY